MREPKFRKGQELFDNANKRTVFINYPNMSKFMVRKNNHVSGFKEEFTGTYNCSWFDGKDKLASGEIEESLLSKPSSTSSNNV